MKNKILQFGSGVFLRGFWAWMIQQVNQKQNFDNSITMVKLTPRGDLSQFENVDGDYNLICKGLLDNQVIDSSEKITVYKDFIHPYQQWKDFLATAKDDDLNIIVSNSTEAGIIYQLCAKPDSCPETYPAKLCAWLYARFTAGKSAPLVLPMELIENNAGKLKDIVTKHAQDWQLEDAFFTWLETDCDFRNTLVDRIVTKGDKLDVCVEPYHLFAIEGEAREDILPLQKSGLNVYWTDNLESFRETKVRMLNGGHTSMIYAALQSGEDIVADALKNEKIDHFLHTILLDEILPTLLAKGGKQAELENYAKAVVERFKNPFLNHKMIDICLNSSSKLLVRILPSFVDYAKINGTLAPKLSQAIAAFFWFYRGQVIDGEFHSSSEGRQLVFGDDLSAMEAIAKCDTSSVANYANSILSCPVWNDAFGDFPELENRLTDLFTQFEQKGLKNTLFSNT